MRVLHVCMHTLYGYCMSMYWTLYDCPVRVCLRQRVGPVGVAGYTAHRSMWPWHLCMAEVAARCSRTLHARRGLWLKSPAMNPEGSDSSS